MLLVMKFLLYYDKVVVRPFASFIRKEPRNEKYFIIHQQLDLRTSCFEDRGNDVTMPRGSTSSKPDPIELPKGPITRARAKHLQEAISTLFAQLWNDNEL
ncbi:hypothetical protein PVK06_027144 [Gossypium arboreum]|uniref:Uncharacterized protein n=1 Tax=Gossypium arboreum TaxID=29729 RepID=A0ABR0NZH1_GOSAR|nr:hypothetical protein PVK06_027144 [Gossypium arboreum]